MQPLHRLMPLLARACFRFLAAMAAMVSLTGQPRADAAVDGSPREPLRFGVLNQQSPIQTAERWNPVLRYLTVKTGIPLQLKMAPTVELTDAMMGREEFDLVYTNHNFQSQFDGGYRVIARCAGSPIRGALVVPEGSPVASLQDLQGQVVAFPSADAFVAYAVPMVALRDAGITVVARFAGNQDGALAQLKAGRVNAAAVNSRFLESYAGRENLRYRTLYVSEPYRELPVLVHPRVAAEQAALLTQTLLGMQNDPSAAAALKAVQCPGFAVATEQDYDNVRRIYRAIGQ